MTDVCEKCGKPSRVVLSDFFNSHPYCSNSCMSILVWDHVRVRKKRIRIFRERKASDKAYEKTFKGFLVRKYRNMKSRITGVQKNKFHLYRGLTILPKERFYAWAMTSPEYAKLFSDYLASGCVRKMAPSVDRIDSSKGYEIENMRWVTHSENSRLGGLCTQEKRRFRGSLEKN